MPYLVAQTILSAGSRFVSTLVLRPPGNNAETNLGAADKIVRATVATPLSRFNFAIHSATRWSMISGAHMVIYTKDAEADRAFFRDVLEFPSVDAGQPLLSLVQSNGPHPAPNSLVA